jgi:hypothetical protein
MNDNKMNDADFAESVRWLINNYAFALDGRNEEMFLETFTPAAILEIFEPEGLDPVVTYRGHDEIGTIPSLVSSFRSTFHLMMNHVSNRISDEEGSGTTYCVAHHLLGDGNTSFTDIMMLIQYDDQYQRDNGSWRIKHRKVLRKWNVEVPADLATMASKLGK